MKKTITMLLTIFMMVAFIGCAYKGYSGDRRDLYTEAVNSVLWNNGHSFSADRYADAQIEIIEEDSYGRTLFTYYEKYYAGASISFSALLVSQASTKDEVFYYEDINYIVKEQVIYEVPKEFEDAEIEKLKEANDWNEEINLDKCIKKKITNLKPSVPFEEEIKNKVIDEFHLADTDYSLFIDFLTNDSADSNFIVYGYVDRYDEDEMYFISLIESSGGALKQIELLVPSNALDCQSELIEFKRANGWR